MHETHEAYNTGNFFLEDLIFSLLNNYEERS